MAYADPERQRAYNKTKSREYYEKHRDRLIEESCDRAKKLTREQRRDYHFRSRYGISHADYDRMLEEQCHRCKICGVHASEATTGRLHVDHMHCTGKVRALLCGHCNKAIGLLKDDPKIIAAARDCVASFLH